MCPHCATAPMNPAARFCGKCGSPLAHTGMIQATLPSNVARFEQLMYLSLGLGLVHMALVWDRLVADFGHIGGARFVGFAVFYAFAITALCIWQAAREHKNWARWFLLILFAISLPGTLSESRVPVVIVSIGELAAQAVALFLIFSGNARGWFGDAVKSIGA